MNLKDYNNYLLEISNEIGENAYPFSTTPIVINKEQSKELKSISEKVLDIIMKKEFYMEQYAKDWFLPKTQLIKNDFIGSVDFHVTNNSYKIIEINLAPIGKINLIELMEKTMLKNINKKSLYGESSMLLEKLIYSIHQNKYKRIAICDWDIKNQPNVIEFQYIKKKLENIGLYIEIENATDLYLDKNKNIIGKKGENYDRIYNRLVPIQWENNISNLQGLTDIFNHDYHVFYNNPNAWILSNKNILNELPKIDISLREYVPKSEPLSNFESIDRVKRIFKSTSKIVIKPSNEFASSSIFYKPSNVIIKNLIEQKKDMIIQEFCPPGKLEYIHTDKECYNLKYDLRVIFVNGKVSGLSSRIYEGAITNFRSGKGGFAPVFITKD